MHAKQRNEAIRHVVAYVFTIAMVFLAVIPFIYVVLTALKTKEPVSYTHLEQYLDFLRDFLKDKSYIHLAYMTGILPVKKYGTHSALNKMCIRDRFPTA